MSGFYLMHRGWMDNPVFEGEPFSMRDAWSWMIQRAAYRETKHKVAGTVITVPRGSFVTTVRELAAAWGWSKSRVHRVLKTFENQDMIRTDSGTGKTVVTVCNYDEYQNVPGSSGTTAGQAAGQQRDNSGTLKKKGNEGKEVEDAPLPPAGPSPADDASEAVVLWNALAAEQSLPSVQKLTKARQSALAARLRDGGGLDGWREALARIRGSPGLLGQAGGDWRANFDWLVSERGFTKLMEGNYGGWGSRSGGAGRGGGRTASALAGIFDLDPAGELGAGMDGAGAGVVSEEFADDLAGAGEPFGSPGADWRDPGSRFPGPNGHPMPCARGWPGRVEDQDRRVYPAAGPLPGRRVAGRNG